MNLNFKKYFQHPALIYIIYIIFIILCSPSGFSWLNKIIFSLCALVPFWIVREKLLNYKKANILPINLSKYNKYFVALLCFALFFFIASKIFLFIKYGIAPLGYDTGFYLRGVSAMGLATTKLNAVNAYYFIFTPLLSLGMEPLIAFYSICIFSQFLTLIALCFLLKTFRSPTSFNLAIIAIFLYAMSSVQFLGYWNVFGQQLLAMPFLLISVALLMRRSVLAIFTAGITFLLHTATAGVLFLGIAIYYIIYFFQLFSKNRYCYKSHFSIVIIGIVLAVPFYILKSITFKGQLDYIIHFGGLLKNVPFWQIPELSGFFIGIQQFNILTLFIIPLALTTLLNPAVWLREKVNKSFFFNSLLINYVFLALLAILALSPVIYQTRFNLMLDLFLIIFATPTILILIEYFIKDKTGRLILLAMIFLFTVNFCLIANKQQPLISKSELQEIKSLASKVESNAKIMTTSSTYTPWLYGFYGREVIAPGRLGDTWELETWKEFWFGDSDKKRLELLKTRPMPLYVYIGEKELDGNPYQNFVNNDPHFENITEHLWKFKQEL